MWPANTRDGIAISGGSHSLLLQELVRTCLHGGPLYETPAARQFLGDIVDGCHLVYTQLVVAT